VRRMLPWGVLVLVLVVGGCRRATGSGVEPGARSSQEAVLAYLSAARAKDLQAMSAVWGNEEGLVRDREDRTAFERRLIVIACHLRHEESRIGEPLPGEAGRTIHRVDLTNGGRTVTVPFTTVRNRRSGRWFVEEIDLRPAREICTPAGGMTRPQSSESLSIR